MAEPVGLVLLWAAALAVVALVAAVGQSALGEVTCAEAEEATARVLTLVHRREAALGALAFVRLAAGLAAVGLVVLGIAGWFTAWWAVAAAWHVVVVVAAFVMVRWRALSVGRRYPMAVLRAGSGTFLAATRALGWLVRGRVAAPAPDLHDVVELAESEGVEEEDRELIRSVFELGHTIAREVMVPRTDMLTTARTASLRAVQAMFLQSGFSRMPVTGGSADDVVGVVYLKDVARRLAAGDGEEVEVGALMRPALFLPESKPADDLLREMQAGASHMAMVVDEYGGIAGLVTIEDVLEEIVGELTDEHDPPAAEVEDLGHGVLRVPARLGIEELGELFDLDLDDDIVDTAGGLLAKALGKVPLPGSVAMAGPLVLVADRVEGRRKQLATLRVALSDGAAWATLLGEQ